MDALVETAPTAAQLQRRRRQKWLLSLTAAAVVAAILVALWWVLYASHYQSTDDAYVAGDLVNVMPQVNGTVVSIDADETDLVSAGQELIRLDPTDLRIALQDAEQQLARTVRQTRTVFATRDQLLAVVGQRRSDLTRAESDFNRRKDLAATGAVSSEELGHARDALSAAREALTAAQKNLAASTALVGRTGVADNPDVQAAATQVERAWLNLKRTSVRAPVSGYVARRAAQLGDRIAPGAPLMALVPLERLRVEANFKEVQLTRMRIGQPVTVVADLYGGSVEYHGTVAGVGLGTGAAFALLPAQNATGNWIKVVQRVPVRIELDPQELKAHPLRIGLSTRVSVTTVDTSGPALAQRVHEKPVLTTDVYEMDNGDVKARIAEIIRDNTTEGAATGKLHRSSLELEVTQGQGGRVLDRLERETCAHVLELDRSDEALVDHVVGIDVGHHDTDEVVDIAAHAVDLGHLGDVAHRAHEALEPRLAVIAGLEGHEHRGADVERVCIQQRHPLADHPIGLQLLDAPPAGGLGESDAVGDLGGAQLTVALQQVQDFGIELIHETPFLWKPILRNIVAQVTPLYHTFATT